MRVLAVGSDALLVEVDGAEEALSLALHARASGAPAVEVVPAATTVLLDGVADHAAVRAVLSSWTGALASADQREVEVPVVYDGADLDDVAGLWGTDREGVVERHQATTFTSAFCGFAPGFAYLTGLPAELAVPRLDSPRSRVPAGSVGLAGEYCGVYPTASPGGWRLLGRTDTVLWDPASAQPALLAPGTRVRFVAR